MEHVTPTGGDQPTIQQMFATLLGEIATLQRQNEDQQRQLEHLRNTTSLFLERNDVSLQTSSKLRFKHFPVEIREMIWELAMPSRLLGFPGFEYGVPSTLPIPAIAQVCQEPRRVFTARKQYTIVDRNYVLPPLWRLKDGLTAHWSSFRPHTDALLINPGDFLRGDHENNYPITWVAEHIVVESATAWVRFIDSGFERGHEKAFTNWIEQLAMFAEYCPPIKGGSLTQAPISTRAPVCHLRTVDFVMGDVTMVDHNYPPNLVHRLFAGNCVKIVDLRDRKAVDTIQTMIENELYQVIQPAECTGLPTDIEASLDIFKETATGAFARIKSRLLRTLARAYCTESVYGDNLEKKYLPSPYRDDGKWDMEVTWAKELCKRIDVRPVHVFVRAEGISEVDW